MNIFNLIQEIEKHDPEVYSRLDSRRRIFKNGLKLAAAALPFTFATTLQKAYGKGNDAITDVLNFALTLEYLEDEFYAKGLAASGLIPADRKVIFQQISKHESAHVALLKTSITSLGATPVSKPNFDFTGGKNKGGGPYADVFTNYQTFLALSQAFEDTGVRAYKGQATVLIPNPDVLTVALQIHSVEARHASMVRRLRGNQGWINGKDSTGLPQAIYDGEDNTTEGGLNVTTLGYSAAIVSQAFDETLTKEQVLAIAGGFIY